MRYPMNLIRRVRPSLTVVIALGTLAFAWIGTQAAELQEITVTVPVTKTIGRDANGAPIQQVTASARVQYDPMMLTTRSGRAQLQERVTEVARELCREVNDAAPPPATGEDSCVEQAVHGAKVQIAAAAIAQKAG
jgi:UrcA family protein